MQLDDIHSSARILMQLKSTQRRLSDNGHLPNEIESDSSCSDDRSELYRNDDSYDCVSKDQVFIDRPYPSVFGAKFHSSNGYASGTGYSTNEARFEKRLESHDRERLEQAEEHDKRRKESFICERIMRPKLSPNAVQDDRRLSVRASFSPEKMPKSSHIYLSRYSPINGIENSISKQSPPKKELNKGFHISTILGLKDDKVAEQRFTAEANGNAQLDRENEIRNRRRYDEKESPADRTSGQKGLASIRDKFGTEKDTVRRVSGNAAKMRYTVDLSDGDGSSCKGARRNGDIVSHHHVEASNMDDIKTSFAHLLQGFTATITRSIDRSIDTIFKP